MVPSSNSVTNHLSGETKLPMLVNAVDTGETMDLESAEIANDEKNNLSPTSDSLFEDEAQAKLEEAKLKKAWTDTMKDFGLAGKNNKNTAVLLLSWADEFDDLNTSKEVAELESVFENDFNYKVRKRELGGRKRPCFQISKHLLEFVDEYDGESTLLIVYYAGHGIPGERGELHLAGNRQPDQKRSLKNAAAWHESENIIKNAEADVLLIFDCCYAGNLLPRNVRSYYHARNFECIAACGKDETTSWPSPESFTRALIWSLKTLVRERKRFSTQELQASIMNDAPNFPKRQSVPLIERDEPSDQRLILAPLPKASATDSEPSEVEEQKATPYREYYLDLRLWYVDRPDEEEIQTLAKRLKNLIINDCISARMIGWVGLKNVRLQTIRGVADRFNCLTRRPQRTSEKGSCKLTASGSQDVIISLNAPESMERDNRHDSIQSRENAKHRQQAKLVDSLAEATGGSPSEVEKHQTSLNFGFTAGTSIFFRISSKAIWRFVLVSLIMFIFGAGARSLFAFDPLSIFRMWV